MKTIAFFNNKGGVRKTSLVYHLAWMYAEQRLKVLTIDLDPQANLTAMFLDENKLETLWPEQGTHQTVAGAIEPILKGIGDIATPHIEHISENLKLIPGDLGLSSFEDKLSDAWPRCHNNDESAFRTMTAFHRLMLKGGGDDMDLVLMDVGPNLGAINRAALIAADYFVVPLAPDLFSLVGLRNLGPTLGNWRKQWENLKIKAPVGLELPKGGMQPMGYVVMQHGVRDSRPVKAYQRWLERIPNEYKKAVLSDSDTSTKSCQLALLKHYRSLMPMSMEAHKPVFLLKASDGVIGSHVQAVQACYEDFLKLAQAIAEKIDVKMPNTEDEVSAVS